MREAECLRNAFMGRQLKFIFGIAVIVGTVGFLVWTAVDQTKMYMITVAEFLDAGSAYANSTVRIAGKVAKGSMVWKSETRDLEFTVVDMAGAPGEVRVHYRGLLPDMFAEDRDVVVEGPYTSSSPFEARAVLTSCPSKYQAEGEAKDGHPHNQANPQDRAAGAPEDRAAGAPEDRAAGAPEDREARATGGGDS